MRNYKLHIIFFCLTIVGLDLMAQQAGVNKRNLNANTILDLSNNPNKTLALPVVAISSITDAAIINGISPANGLMIYNPTRIGNLLDGIYIWQSGSWGLLSAPTNNLLDILFKGSQSSLLTTAADNTYQTILPATNYSLIQNDIAAASINSSTGEITLPAGNYTMEVNLNIRASNEDNSVAKSLGSTAPGSLTQKNAHLHTYNAKLINASGTTISTVASINGISNTSSSSTTTNKTHAINFVFSFSSTTAQVLRIQLAHVSGGTYHFIGSTNPGGTSTTSASIDLNEVIVHIQKAI